MASTERSGFVPPRPWRAFPARGAPPDVRLSLPRLPRDLVDRLLKAARKDLHRWLLEELRERETRRRRSMRGFRPGVWPHDRLVAEALLLSQDHRLVAACVAVMLLEHDGPTEDRIAGALDEVRKSDNASSTLLADRLAAMLPGQPYTAVLAELAWAFKDFGKGVPVPVPKAPLLPPVTGVVPNATVVASELKDAHAALTGAMARMRDVVVALDAANEVPRDEAEAALDAALRSASRVREGLAAAALLSPTAVAEPATSADQLATIVARAA